MKKTTFVIKYDLIDEAGNSVMTGDYCNALAIPVNVESMNHRDCIGFTNALMDFINRYAATPLVYPFFPQIQDKTPEELKNSNPYRFDLVFPEFHLKNLKF